MLRVRIGEGRLVIYGLVGSFKAEKRKVNEGDSWFRVSTPPALSLSLSLSLSLIVRVLVCGVVCLLLIWLRCREICLLYRFYLLVRSKWVFFVFYREGHGLAEKLLLIIFISLINFIDISLCADPMRKSSFFHFEESHSIDNIR